MHNYWSNINEKRKMIRFKIFCTLVIIFSGIALTNLSFPQYQVYQWGNFEDKKFPPQAGILGTSEKISIVDITKMKDLYPNLLVKESGSFCLMLRADKLPEQIRKQKTGKDKYLTGMGLNVRLNRDQIGNKGRALYQADFYVPPPPAVLPNIAVLAMAPLNPGETTPSAMYRFGMINTGQVFFSYVVKDSLEAALYKDDEEIIKSVSRPGWHRFAIVFEGAETIRCYIDGHETSFSPIKEPTLRKLIVGVMLAEYNNDYLCFVDNPSIQWTMEDAPLPDSPYASTWMGYVKPQSEKIMESVTVDNKLEWLDGNEGWKRANQLGKNMFIYFQAPRVRGTEILNTIFQQNPAAQAFLKNYVLVNIDVNQLQGGKYAEQFGIFKVPTVVILTPRNETLCKEMFGKNDTWESFSARIAK